MVRIDLHTHSNRSDGTTSPAQLVRHALDLGNMGLAQLERELARWDP